MACGETGPIPRDIQLQACLAEPDGVSEYRFLVDRKDIKYITVEPGTIPPDDISFEPVLKSLLPIFPPGDWNKGQVAKDNITGNAIFTTTVHSDLPGVRDAWRGNKIDHLQLTWIDRMRQNIRLVTCPLFQHPVVYKFAEFPWQISMIERETTAYGWLHGRCIGPQFLGHVTEAGRVMGFLIEHVPGRTAEVEDLDKCQRALKRLHALRLKHGDANKYNFLIRDGKEEAVLVDFEATVRCQDEDELLREFEGLRGKPEETDGKGGVIELRDESSK